MELLLNTQKWRIYYWLRYILLTVNIHVCYQSQGIQVLEIILTKCGLIRFNRWAGETICERYNVECISRGLYMVMEDWIWRLFLIKGAGGVLTLEWWKLSLMLFLIEESDSYQILFTEWKNIATSRSYCTLKTGKYM